MPLIPVSADDERLSPYRNLPRSNLTRQSGRFVVEGKWLVERLAASDHQIESIVVNEGQVDLIPAGLSEAVPVYALPAGDVEKLIGFNFHRGILACGRRKPMPSSQEVIPPTGPATIVACIDIHDPTNLGGILRNCAAFGVDGVLLSRRCADPFSRRVLRVSMGTAFKLRIAIMEDALTELSRLQTDNGCELVATVLSEDAEHLQRAVRPQRMVLLIGNEGHGLPIECQRIADRRVTLPMRCGTDSLNAAAATAVFLYHFTQIENAS